MKSTSPLNRFGARYRDKDGNFRNEKNWRSRETGNCHIAKKGEIYPYGYDPTFYPHRLNEPLKIKKPSKIFVVDAGDMFGNWVPEEWIKAIIDVVKSSPWHIFQFLTKNPERLIKYNFPNNAWVGTSINRNKDREKAETIKRAKAAVKFLSIEPLLGPVSFNMKGIDWIIIGAQTGNNPVRPDKKWIDEIVRQAMDLNIPLFFKENIRKYSNFFMQEYPMDLLKVLNTGYSNLLLFCKGLNINYAGMCRFNCNLCTQ